MKMMIRLTTIGTTTCPLTETPVTVQTVPGGSLTYLQQ
jgi:hypothetical protein